MKYPGETEYIRKGDKNSIDTYRWEAYSRVLLRASTRHTRASRTHCQRVSPLRREGLAILALRTLNRQPYFFHLFAVQLPLGAPESCAFNLYPIPCPIASVQRAPRAAARFVGPSLQVLRQKPLHPFVDKTADDPNRGGHVGNRHPISQEQNNPALSSTPRRDGAGVLPRQQRLAFGRRKADRERGGASTRHPKTSQAGEYEFLEHVPEQENSTPHFQGYHNSDGEEYQILV